MFLNFDNFFLSVLKYFFFVEIMNSQNECQNRIANKEDPD